MLRGDLDRLFAERFEVRVARSEAERRDAMRVRHRVYCEELRYEPDDGEGLERDAHDARSAHGLVVDRATGRGVATVRLVLGREGLPLPLEARCRDRLHPAFAARLAGLPRGACGEVSRFSVVPELRRGGPGGRQGARACRADRREVPWATVGLFRALLELSAEHRVRHWLALMEPRLVRLLARLGAHFEIVGAAVDLNGARVPCYADVAVLTARTARERPDVWRFTTAGGALAAPTARARGAAGG